MELFKKPILTFLLFVAVFLISYLVAYMAISITPYGYYTEHLYSKLPSQVYYYPAFESGAWRNQMLSPNPEPGSTSIPRDTAIWIDEPRPVKVENVSFSPKVSIGSITDEHFPVASATITVYSGELLQPNTIYNVSAIVAGTPSWWIFTTSSEPSQPRLNYFSWVTFAAAIIATLIVFLVILLQRKKH